MLRVVTTLGLLLLFLCSSGCRMCSTPYDCRVPANINRQNDYRGFSQMYRGGSVFTCEGCNTYQQVIRDGYSRGCPENYFCNAGNYGLTSHVSIKRQNFDDFDTPSKANWSRDLIAIPQDEPDKGFNYVPRNGESNVPSVNEIIKQPRGTPPSPLSEIPITKPKKTPPSFDSSPEDTIPFSPSDEKVVPPAPFPHNVDVESPISLEELRRLDPSVQDVQILSIEDAGMEVLTR